MEGINKATPTQYLQVIISCLLCFPTIQLEAKIFTLCELESELVQRNISQENLTAWICMAKRLSSFNSSLLSLIHRNYSSAYLELELANNKTIDEDHVQYHGIFQISDAHWCAKDDIGILKSGCNISCSKFLDDDISDDIDCALKIAISANANETRSSWNKFRTECEQEGNLSCRYEQPSSKLPQITNLKNGDQRLLRLSDSPQIILCHARGDPQPYVRWEYNETEFPNLYSTLTSNGQVLIFPDVNSSFEGEFTCVASNTLGTTNVTVSVRVVEIVDSESSMSKSGFLFGFISGLVFSVFATCLLLGIMKCRRMGMKKVPKVEVRGLTKEEIDEFRNGDPDGLIFNAFAHENAPFQAYNNDYEILDDQLIIETDKLLGSGQFGLVYKGWKGGREVAVKTLKPSADKLYIKALLSELKVMIYIGKHENIVNLIGAKTKSLDRGSLHIIVELCALGSLESFIRNNKQNFVRNDEERDEQAESHYANLTTLCDTMYENTGVLEGQAGSHYANLAALGHDHTVYEHTQTTFSKNDLINWSYQIASGMKYLVSKKVIHGDLATRNILLSDKNHLKITDFGLSRQLYDYTNYVKKQQAPLPWRWMAIESLRSLTFSHQSDIWSFAVTLWEIFTLGEIPYAGSAWNWDFLDQLDNGLRLLKPKHCSDEMYEKMADCWHRLPSERPDISYMHSFIERLLA